MPALIQNGDFAVLDAIQHWLRSPFMDRLMPFITHLGDNGYIWIATAVVLLCIRRYRRDGLTLALTLAIEFTGNELILKNIFRRPRPCDIAPLADMLINRPSGWSLPSGHTAVSFAAATALFSVNKKWGLCAYGAAAVIGFTRLYLYVHFPTDVLAGVLCGLAFGWIGVRLGKILFKRIDIQEG